MGGLIISCTVFLDEEVNIVNRLVVNEDELREVKMLGGSYMIPANCSFLLSDIQHMEPLIHGTVVLLVCQTTVNSVNYL